MNRAERLRTIQRIHDEWEEQFEGTVEPDPQYSGNKPSQYPEGILDVSASPAQFADFLARLEREGVFSPSPVGTPDLVTASALRPPSESFMARWLAAYRFNPNQPRDSRGRWRSAFGVEDLPRISGPHDPAVGPVDTPKTAMLYSNPGYKAEHDARFMAMIEADTGIKGPGTEAVPPDSRSRMLNCQKCVTAYELRRRGYDVTALPGKDGTGEEGLMRWFPGLKKQWRRPENSIPDTWVKDVGLPTRGFSDFYAADVEGAKTRKSAATTHIINAYPKDSRGVLLLGFGADSMHVVNWERNVKSVDFRDAQKGEKVLTRVEDFIDTIPLRAYRLDDLDLAEDLSGAVEF